MQPLCLCLYEGGGNSPSSSWFSVRNSEASGWFGSSMRTGMRREESSSLADLTGGWCIDCTAGWMDTYCADTAYGCAATLCSGKHCGTETKIPSSECKLNLTFKLTTSTPETKHLSSSQPLDTVCNHWSTLSLPLLSGPELQDVHAELQDFYPERPLPLSVLPPPSPHVYGEVQQAEEYESSLLATINYHCHHCFLATFLSLRFYNNRPVSPGPDDCVFLLSSISSSSTSGANTTRSSTLKSGWRFKTGHGVYVTLVSLTSVCERWVQTLLLCSQIPSKHNLQERRERTTDTLCFFYLAQQI